MNRGLLAGFSAMLIGVAAIVGAGCTRRPANAPGHANSSMAAAPPPGSAPGDSGVYGFSGARVPDGDPQGVIGECIWIYDASNRNQVAKGDCIESAPGKFRVPLKPGNYVVRGPGGSKPIEVKPGGWIRIMSIVALPMSP
jgi:hypothetical protein